MTDRTEVLLRQVRRDQQHRAMNILKMLAELRAYQAQLIESIAALERLAAGGVRRRGRPPLWLAQQTGKRRGRPPGSKNKAPRKGPESAN